MNRIQKLRGIRSRFLAWQEQPSNLVTQISNHDPGKRRLHETLSVQFQFILSSCCDICHIFEGKELPKFEIGNPVQSKKSPHVAGRKNQQGF